MSWQARRQLRAPADKKKKGDEKKDDKGVQHCRERQDFSATESRQQFRCVRHDKPVERREDA